MMGTLENHEPGLGISYPVKKTLCEKEKILFSQACLEESMDIMCETQLLNKQ